MRPQYTIVTTRAAIYSTFRICFQKSNEERDSRKVTIVVYNSACKYCHIQCQLCRGYRAGFPGRSCCTALEYFQVWYPDAQKYPHKPKYERLVKNERNL
jgi:hypothetical protein